MATAPPRPADSSRSSYADSLSDAGALLLPTATRVTPATAKKDQNRKNDNKSGSIHDDVLLWYQICVTQPECVLI
jgi:hypothetical protein